MTLLVVDNKSEISEVCVCVCVCAHSIIAHYKLVMVIICKSNMKHYVCANSH